MSKEPIERVRVGAQKSVFSGNLKKLDAYVYGLMSGAVCVVPNVYDIINIFPELEEYYLGIYEKYYSDSVTPKSKCKVEDIPKDLRMLQGVLLEGYVVGYNKETQDFNIYYGNIEALNRMEGKNDSVDPYKDIANGHSKGFLTGKRIDIRYESEKKFSLKSVNIIGKGKLTVDNNIYIPYFIIQSMMRVLKLMLQGNQALKITQNMPTGGLKERFVSAKTSVVKHYTDKFFDGTAKFMGYPMNMLVYISTLGAPSTTLGMTRVDLMRIEKIEQIKDASNLPIAKVNPDPVNSLVQSELLNTYIENLFKMTYSEDGGVISEKNVKYIEKLEQMMANYGANPGDGSKYDLMRMTHELTAEGLMAVWSELPKSWHSYMMWIKKYMSNIEDVNVNSPEFDLYDLLKNNIVMVTYMTLKNKFNRSIVTNSKKLLTTIYGPDYVGNYESNEVKKRTAVEMVEDGYPYEIVQKKTGIIVNNDGEFEELYREVKNKENYYLSDKQKEYTTARALFEVKGSKRYYQKIPNNRIVKVQIFK